MNATKPRVGVILSGCGFLDGSEIHESVLTLLHLARAGCRVICTAPAGDVRQVVDHSTRQPALGERRSMLVEAARIARGAIVDLAAVAADDLDAVVLPGGFGAAKNLSDFALVGTAATVHSEVARLLRAMHAASKPIGAICIAPAVVAAVLGRTARPLLTIGDDPGTARALEALGARHQVCAVDACVVDRQQRIVSTPAYMYDARIDQVAAGVGALVDALLGLLAEVA